MAPEAGTTTIAVAGGDPLVGTAVGQLVGGFGYGVRLLPEPLFSEEEIGEEALAGPGLLLLSPALGRRRVSRGPIGMVQAAVVDLRGVKPTRQM